MNASIIILFAAVIIIAVLLFAVVTLTKRGTTVLDVDKYRSKWLTIEQSLARDSESSYHLAIMNADKLLDQALRERGFRGQTMGDRMKFARDTWTNRDNVWRAHKLRNQIAHEADVKVSYEQAKRALGGFKQALKDLGAI